jgi:hypothetical protein
MPRGQGGKTVAQIRIERQSVSSDRNRAQFERMLARLVNRGWQIVGVTGIDPVIVILQRGEPDSHVTGAIELDV